MARDPHEAVDFAPAWLNFNNSNKKKSEKTSGTFSLSSPLKLSQDPPLAFRTNSLGLRSSGSPSRSSHSSFRNHHSPSSRTATRHHSVDFSPSYLDNKNGHSSPSREFRSQTRPLAFSPTLASAKSSSMTWNGPTPLHRNSGSRDSSPRLDTEFPSLSDVESSEQIKPVASPRQTSSGSVVNMWQKPLVLKTREPQHLSEQAGSTKSSLTTSIYKTLVPKTSHHKQPYRRTLSVPLVLPSKNIVLTGETVTNGSKKHTSMDGQVMQPSTPKYLTGNTSNLRLAKSELQNSVNSSVVSGHKKHKKGKSHFLQTLRQTENEFVTGVDFPGLEEEKEGVDVSVPTSLTGRKTSDEDLEESKFIHIDEIDADNEKESLEDNILSSSLEAEHRLLKEMGWKYSDDQAMEEEPPLTEDEIQEFRIRCNGVVPSVFPAQREKVLENAFSTWKFSGIRKRSADTDYENNNKSTPLEKQEDTDCPEELDEFSSDDNPF